ncbi:MULTISPECIES: DUF4097 family beta strand repeat-containing protein [unclassified Thalassotalea]|uniref:DUF4097 family beta strand repeat-containing protein n=1 Tax=unclassified Thalassotalea TaxID=2614972 RepID=UPI001080AF16|nr:MULTISPECIES: DUF4097 family beta strand repeat-containing protein [unclassified Thalassotalea]NMP15223.1 DUF4097 family beta strand repeat protein [Thalassotalea sp. Y01]QBY03779.1 hypothetical protein E2K93_05015 [Thalassotalea sp. HSM 43]
MKTINKIILPTLLLASFGSIAAANETKEQRFDLTGKGQLLLENVNGDVEITSWSEKAVLVTANITADDQDDLDNVKVIMKQNGNRIIVETEYQESDGGWGRNSNSGSVDYSVKVPENIDLREIDLVNGSLLVENVAGELNVDIVNGSVEATGMAADVEVDSVNGGVELTFADDAKNVDIEVETVNGGIRLYLPENFGANVDASTGNGSIKTDFGIKSVKGEYWGTDLEGKIGDGSSDIELESVNGSIRLLKK